MKTTAKLTASQLETMYRYLEKYSSKDADKKIVKLLYNPLTPQEVYVAYTSFKVLDDNSIESKVELDCIKPDGSTDDCSTQFDNLKQRLEFESKLIEIDLDANGKIVIL